MYALDRCHLSGQPLSSPYSMTSWGLICSILAGRRWGRTGSKPTVDIFTMTGGLLCAVANGHFFLLLVVVGTDCAQPVHSSLTLEGTLVCSCGVGGGPGADRS